MFIVCYTMEIAFQAWSETFGSDLHGDKSSTIPSAPLLSPQSSSLDTESNSNDSVSVQSKIFFLLNHKKPLGFVPRYKTGQKPRSWIHARCVAIKDWFISGNKN